MMIKLNRLRDRRRHSVFRLFWLILVTAFSLSLYPAIPAQAQAGTLTAYTTVTGSLSSAGASAEWQFAGMESQVISLHVQSDGEGFDPVLTLQTSAGTIVTHSDDIAYPGTSDALLQAVTLPRTDTYTVEITGYQGSTGSYRLTLTSGYPDITANETFDGEVNPYQPSTDSLVIDHAAGQLTLSIAGIGVSGTALNPSAPVFRDFYADALITTTAGRNGWTGGLVLRQQEDQAYHLLINDDGQWRFSLQTGSGEQVLRDWISHPAIVPGQSNFRLGVLANDHAFDVFYNQVFVGQVVDPDRTLADGRIGMIVGTVNVAGSEAQWAFDSLTVTTPHLLGEDDVCPDQLVTGGQALTIQELERRRVIPTGGVLGLTVPESFGQKVSPGVNRIILGRGTTFGDMVLSTNLRWQTAAEGVVGCGLMFGSTSETDYTLAYLDQTGGYGLSQRAGEEFNPGIFNVDLTLIDPDAAQHLLVVRRQNIVRLYVNRVQVGVMSLPPVEGEIGVAVVNYETIDTTCQFNDTWVWRLPPG